MGNEIRVAKNNLNITGVVKEHSLKEGKNDNGKFINGSLTIKAGDSAEIVLRVFSAEKNSKGTPRKVYEVLSKILNEEVLTMAGKATEEEAVKVRVWGNEGFTPQFKEEIFKSEGSADVVTKISFDLGFGNITIDNNITPEDYKAEFDIEMFVESVEEERDSNDEETGRAVIKGWVPVYGGSVIPLELKAGIILDDDGEEIDLAEEILDGIDVESTVNFWGDINYKVMVEKIKKGGSLGKAKIEENRTYVNDLMIVGADIIEDEDEEYAIESIQQAVVERESKIEEVKNKETEDKNSKGKGGKKNRGVGRRDKAKKTGTETLTKADIEEDDDDIPF